MEEKQKQKPRDSVVMPEMKVPVGKHALRLETLKQELCGTHPMRRWDGRVPQEPSLVPTVLHH